MREALLEMLSGYGAEEMIDELWEKYGDQLENGELEIADVEHFEFGLSNEDLGLCPHGCRDDDDCDEC